MEGENTLESPETKQDIWSPDVLCSSHPPCSGAGMTSTPYWPPSFKKLDDSAGSSKQDSGYCSATPSSTDSGGLLFGKSHICNKSLHHSYGQSTPDYICSCINPRTDGRSPNLQSMEAIHEVKMSPTPKLYTRGRLNRPFELFEDAVETSLYHEEMEVDNHLTGENHQCSLEFSELGEEKSIDFMEPQTFSNSQSSSKETTSVCSPSNIHTGLVKVEDCKSQIAEKQDCNFLKVDSEDLFSPEMFKCDLVSPKIKNECTPTKLKRGTPPMKMKKCSSFQSTAKKVATMNRVLRSFPLNGIESVDFLYQLGVKRNVKPVIEKIFSFLSERDLDAVRVVSKTWNKLLHNDFAAFNRWQLYSTTMRLMKENLSSPMKQGGSGGRNRPALTRLQNVANQTSPSRQPFSPQQLTSSPPVSPSSARFRSYQRAVRSLKKDERLLPCPKCRFPSTDCGNPVAQCPRSGCRHRFCVWCNNEVLPDFRHNCPPLYTPRSLTKRNATVPSVGSKSSKRNLRRL